MDGNATADVIRSRGSCVPLAMKTLIQNNRERATLYYDGNCPICLREMARLQRLKSDDLQLRDIHAMLDPSLPDRDTLLRNLHLRYADGRLVTGVEANIAAWRCTPYGRWLSWLRWPLLRPVVDSTYQRWARWRYDRLYSQSCSARGTC